MERKGIPSFTLENTFKQYGALIKNRGGKYILFNLLCYAAPTIFLVVFISYMAGRIWQLIESDYSITLMQGEWFMLAMVQLGFGCLYVLFGLLAASGNALITQSYYDGQRVTVGGLFRYAFRRLGAVASVSLPLQAINMVPLIFIFIFNRRMLNGNSLSLGTVSEEQQADLLT